MPFRLVFITNTGKVNSTSGSASNTHDIPATANAGDLCVVFDEIGGANGTYTHNVISGFTELKFTSGTPGSTMQGSIMAKILTASDVGTTVNGQSLNSTSSPRRRSVVLIFRPTKPILSFAAGAAFNGQTTTGTPTNQSVNAASATKPHLIVAMWGAHITVAVPASTPSMSSFDSGGNQGMYGGYALKNPGNTGNNYTISLADSGTNILMSGYITFTAST